MLNIEKLKEKVNGYRDITLSTEERNKLENRLNEDRIRKQNSCIKYSKNLNDIKSVIGSSSLLEGIYEQHIIINPHIINYDEEMLKNIFRKYLIRYYKQELGQYFHKKKDKQMNMEIIVEYEDEWMKLTGEKHTHLHIILQHNDLDMMNRFNDYMKKALVKRFPTIEYCVKNIDTPEYRTNCYNYVNKENHTKLSNKDFYYSLPNTTYKYQQDKEKMKREAEEIYVKLLGKKN